MAIPDPAEIAAQAAAFGFQADTGSVPVLGTSLPVLVPLPWTSPLFRGRLILLGPNKAAMFSTDYDRENVIRLLWSGPANSLRWRRLGNWRLRLETPRGQPFYLDALSEKRKLGTTSFG